MTGSYTDVPYTTVPFDGQARPPGSAGPFVGIVGQAGPVTSIPRDVMSVTLLQDLVSRIDSEMLALTNLPVQPDTASMITAKHNQLALLRDDLVRYIGDVQKSLININDIPVTVSAVQNFLQSIGPSRSITNMYPDLFNVGKAVAAPAPAPAATATSSLFGDLNLEEAQDLFKNVQDVKWRFEVSYDPALSQKTDLLDRLESLEKRIMVYAQTGKPMPDAVKQVLTRELELITSIVRNTKLVPDAPAYAERQKSQQTRMQPAASYRSDGRTYEVPYQQQQGTYSLFDGVPHDSPDVRIRPGFVMTSEQIRHRGSAAAFNQQAVGGPDYKKRAEEVCRQIRGAGIGAPADFGCIENAAEVSANYSWKGNYAMVCNRLGDTWGSWYPEMFGCPKYNPDDQYNGNLL